MTESVLIKRDDRKYNPLEVTDETPPSTWTGTHVGLRISDGFATLALLPSASSLTKSGSWPAYVYEWLDLLAQQEQAEEEKNQNRRAQNRSRLSPSIEQITRMDQVLYWPAHYIAEPPIMRAVNMVALAHSLGRDVAWVARVRMGQPLLWQERSIIGCQIIATGLIRDNVAVF